MPYRYQRIESSIWFDEKFVQLSEGEQRMWLYILTCPHGNLIGLFPLPIGYMGSDLKLSDQEAKRRLKVLTDKELCSYDEQTNLIFIHNFLEYNPITNPKQIQSARKILAQLPKSYLLGLFVKGAVGTKKGLNEELSAIEVPKKILEIPEKLPTPKEEKPKPPKKEEKPNEEFFYTCEFFSIGKGYHEELVNEFPLVDLPDLYKRLRNDCHDQPSRHKFNVQGKLKALRNTVRNWCLHARPIQPQAVKPIISVATTLALPDESELLKDGKAKIRGLIDGVLTKDKTVQPPTNIDERKKLLEEQKKELGVE